MQLKGANWKPGDHGFGSKLGPDSAEHPLKPHIRTQNRAKRCNRLDNRNRFGTRGSEVQILSPRPFFHTLSLNSLCRFRGLRFFGSFRYIRYNFDLFSFSRSVFLRGWEVDSLLSCKATDVCQRGSSVKSGIYKDALKMTL